MKVKTLLVLILFSSIYGCTATTMEEQENTAIKDNTGSLIEIQLVDLKNEVKQLRIDIAQMRSAVTEIHKASVQAKVKTQPSKPVAAKVDKVDFGDDPVIGDDKAKIAIIEFSDYQCPYCSRHFKQTFDQLKKAYVDTGKVKYVFKDYPLQFHAQAKPAAVAANCAGKQGKYWDLHKALFEKQRELKPDLYEDLAKQLQLNAESFRACLNDPVQLKEVNADFDYGNKIGVRGTPNFFIGKIEDDKIIDVIQITGARSYAYFSKAIDSIVQ